MTYRFLSPAQQELAEAIDYYDNASPGLGLEFLDEVEHTVNRILLNPEAWAPFGESFRRCRTRRFPYGLVYFTEHNTVIIVAVANLYRDPESWKSRLGQ